ncbi:TPA: response regulator [Legionella pneumophila]|nr:response regulator [Legionella pneumophila]
MFVSDNMEISFYHPTNVIFFDDNYDFLNAIKLQYGEKYNLHICTNYHDVKSLLAKDSQRNLEINPPKYNDNFLDARSCSDVGSIIDYLCNQGRFSCISVLVVDYEMPEINGIKFCENIKGKNIFKILLTAEADKDTAIRSFNAGLIDKFILKTSKNLHEELENAINELMERYFLSHSYSNVQNQEKLFTHIPRSQRKLFEDALKYSNAVEYYKIDNSGSYLMLDSEGYPTWLVVKPIVEIDQQLELLDGYEGCENLVKAILKKQKILFMPTECDYKLSIQEWDKYLININEINNTHYYALFKGHFTEQIEWEKIESFGEYQSKKYLAYL